MVDQGQVEDHSGRRHPVGTPGAVQIEPPLCSTVVNEDI